MLQADVLGAYVNLIKVGSAYAIGASNYTADRLELLLQRMRLYVDGARHGHMARPLPVSATWHS